jgi:hypothetical protein
MVRARSDLAGGMVEAEGEPGIHTWITVARSPDGSIETAAWLTLDGAYEAESEAERQGWEIEVLEAEA